MSELLHYIELKQNIVNLQVYGGGNSLEENVDSLFSGFSEASCMLMDPEWLTQNWRSIEKNIGNGKILLRFYLPDPAAEYVVWLADSMGLAKDELETRIRTTARGLEDKWNYLLGAKRLQEGSKIEIRFMNSAPSYSIIVVDNKASISLPRSTRNVPSEPDFTLNFDGHKSKYPISWFNVQIEHHNESNVRYEGIAK